MAVLAMQRIRIYALKRKRKQILEMLQRRGVVEITDCKAEDDVFRKADTAQAQAVFEKNKGIARQALEVLQEYAPEKKGMLSMLNGRESISLGQYERQAEQIEEIMKTAYHLLTLKKEETEQNAEAQRLEAQIEALKPWMSLDVSMRLKSTRSTGVFIGSFSEPYSQEELEAKLLRAFPLRISFHLEIISTAPEQTCVFLVCSRKDASELEEAIRAMGFARPSAPSKLPPAEQAQRIRERVEQAQKSAEKARQEILSLQDNRENLCFAHDYYAMREEKYQIISRLAQSSHLFVAEGYVPQRNAAALERELSTIYYAAVELAAPGEGEEIPIALSNNAFSAPVEGVVEGFSMPGRGEIDPSSIMAVFYYVMFGLMLSDAGYGLLMTVACGVILLKFKNLEDSMRKTMRMFFYCGISTVVWGILFGSYFGDAITVISRTFFNSPVTIPALWFVPVEDPMRMLLYSFVIGIIHLFVGLGIQGYQLCRAKRYKDALYDAGFWLLLLSGLIVFALSSPMVPGILSIPFVLPGICGTIAGAVAGVAAVGIVLTSGRESKNPAKRFFKGLYGLYNVSGYLSDLLSYSRLLALGLATGVIASVINQMASMVGGSAIGAVAFVLIFLVGHTLNIAINLLGAYVHTIRLQYVEFFGKFYEGGGRKFAPFSAATKYFKIKE